MYFPHDFPGGADLCVALCPSDPQSSAPRPDVAAPRGGTGGCFGGAEAAAAGAAHQRAAAQALGDVVSDAGAWAAWAVCLGIFMVRYGEMEMSRSTKKRRNSGAKCI